MKVYPANGMPQQVRDDNGVVLVDGRIFTYFAGTTSAATTWQDPDGEVEHTNPIILDGQGRLPGTGLLFLRDDRSYKLIVRKRTGVMIGSYDDILVATQVTPGGQPAESTAFAPRIVYVPGVATPVPIDDPLTPDGAAQLIFKDAGGPGRFYVGDPTRNPPDVQREPAPGVVWTSDLFINVSVTDPIDASKVSVDLVSYKADWTPLSTRFARMPPGSYRLMTFPDTRFQVLVTTSSALVGSVDVDVTAIAVTVP